MRTYRCRRRGGGGGAAPVVGGAVAAAVGGGGAGGGRGGRAGGGRGWGGGGGRGGGSNGFGFLWYAECVLVTSREPPYAADTFLQTPEDCTRRRNVSKLTCFHYFK